MLNPILIELVVVMVVEVMVVVIGLVGEVEEIIIIAVVKQDSFDLQKYLFHQHPYHHSLEIVFGLLMTENDDQVRMEWNCDF